MMVLRCIDAPAGTITAMQRVRRWAIVVGFLMASDQCLIEPSVGQDYEARRERLVAEEIEAAGVEDPRVLATMRSTPRHEFVPSGFLEYAYVDAALPIGEQQTISPPFVVAYMTEQLKLQPDDRVLEIGTGSGYQAAVLSPLVKDVYTIEIVERLGRRAERTLKRLGYDNVHVRIGDGYQGWPEEAPFDKIIVTCSPEKVPQPLVDQLADGGTMIVPVGERYRQNLYRLTKRDGQLSREALRATLFVPMTGVAEDRREELPDPASPSVYNGSFEQTIDDQQRVPGGWHYLRAAAVVEGSDAPDGQRFLRFENHAPGEPGRALQGLAVDGREVVRLEASIAARGTNLRAGPTADQAPAAMVTFYDARRAVIDNVVFARFSGQFDWTVRRREIAVPLAAREAILRIGLLGGTGRLDVDNFQLVRIRPD